MLKPQLAASRESHATGSPARLSVRALPLAAGVALYALACSGAMAAQAVRHAQFDSQKAAPAAQQGAPANAPVASAARIIQSGDVTRLSFTLSASVSVRAFVLASPARVIVDLPETVFAFDPPEAQKPAPPPARRHGRKGVAGKAAPSSASLIASYRFGRLAPGKSRVVIDLTQAARIVQAVTETDADGVRLVVDLVRTDAASFAAAVASARSLASPAPEAAKAGPAPHPAPARSAKPVIIIDPGHGGVDAGAQVAGKPAEKDIVFEFARALGRRLEGEGRFAVHMTRNEDVFVPLAERVRIARAADAQLFISIHADTLNGGNVSGATVYTVSDRASDAEAARLAEKENLSDSAAGFETGEESAEVSDILFDLTRRETRAYSHVFARTLVSVWKQAAGLNKNPQRSAGFKVLKAPDVPSVLLELGYLSSQKDAALLTAPEWREKTAAAVAKSINAFFDMRAGARGTAAGAGPESGLEGFAATLGKAPGEAARSGGN
ncbi:MAG: N-acetylmuramoyl-L-alanine amidase [Hyphomicrobiales bacterium]|nr:N-acetylmuramoyl-L-alanine amidase [Hyphomicrobiales bacterium]